MQGGHNNLWHVLNTTDTSTINLTPETCSKCSQKCHSDRTLINTGISAMSRCQHHAICSKKQYYFIGNVTNNQFIHHVQEKRCHSTLACNFAKCWSIFKILSTDLSLNCQPCQKSAVKSVGEWMLKIAKHLAKLRGKNRVALFSGHGVHKPEVVVNTV